MMKKKLTSADMHDVEALADTPWFSMRKVGIDMAPGDRRDFLPIHYPRPAVGLWRCRMTSVADCHRYLIDRVVGDSFRRPMKAKTREAAPARAGWKRPAGRRSAPTKLSAITLLRQQRPAVYYLAGPRLTGGKWMKIRMK